MGQGAAQHPNGVGLGLGVCPRRGFSIFPSRRRVTGQKDTEGI